MYYPNSPTSPSPMVRGVGSEVASLKSDSAHHTSTGTFMPSAPSYPASASFGTPSVYYPMVTASGSAQLASVYQRTHPHSQHGSHQQYPPSHSYDHYQHRGGRDAPSRVASVHISGESESTIPLSTPGGRRGRSFGTLVEDSGDYPPRIDGGGRSDGGYYPHHSHSRGRGRYPARGRGRGRGRGGYGRARGRSEGEPPIRSEDGGAVKDGYGVKRSDPASHKKMGCEFREIGGGARGSPPRWEGKGHHPDDMRGRDRPFYRRGGGSSSGGRYGARHESRSSGINFTRGSMIKRLSGSEMVEFDTFLPLSSRQALRSLKIAPYCLPRDVEIFEKIPAGLREALVSPLYKLHCKVIIDALTAFVKSSSIAAVFAPVNSFSRMLIHQLAAQIGLDHNMVTSMRHFRMPTLESSALLSTGGSSETRKHIEVTRASREAVVSTHDSYVFRGLSDEDLMKMKKFHEWVLIKENPSCHVKNEAVACYRFYHYQKRLLSAVKELTDKEDLVSFKQQLVKTYRLQIIDSRAPKLDVSKIDHAGLIDHRVAADSAMHGITRGIGKLGVSSGADVAPSLLKHGKEERSDEESIGGSTKIVTGHSGPKIVSSGFRLLRRSQLSQGTDTTTDSSGGKLITAKGRPPTAGSLERRPAPKTSEKGAGEDVHDERLQMYSRLKQQFFLEESESKSGEKFSAGKTSKSGIGKTGSKSSSVGEEDLDSITATLSVFSAVSRETIKAAMKDGKTLLRLRPSVHQQTRDIEKEKSLRAEAEAKKKKITSISEGEKVGARVHATPGITSSLAKLEEDDRSEYKRDPYAKRKYVGDERYSHWEASSGKDGRYYHSHATSAASSGGAALLHQSPLTLCQWTQTPGRYPLIRPIPIAPPHAITPAIGAPSKGRGNSDGAFPRTEPVVRGPPSYASRAAASRRYKRSSTKPSDES